MSSFVFQSFLIAVFSLLIGGLKKAQGTPAWKKSPGIWIQTAGKIPALPLS
jgi:hypothetical protein